MFVSSGGSIQTLSKGSATVSRSVRLSDDYTADYATIWRTQSSVRTVISFLARNVASLGLHVFDRVDDNERQRLAQHPLARLLRNPGSGVTTYRLIYALMTDLGIYDRAYWYKIGGGENRQLLRLPPDLVTARGDSWLYPEEFEVSGSRGKKRIPADQVVFFRGYHPSSNFDGCPPMESLRRILAEEWEAGRWREQTLRNGARFAGIIERPKDAPPWGDEAFKRFKTSWQEQYAGGGTAAGGTPILEDGMSFKPNAQTAEQAQYIESRKLTREEAAAAYFVSPPMVGLLDHATFSNITELHKMLYQDTLGPVLEEIVQDIVLQLLPDLDPTPTVYVEFNLEQKLKGSFEEQAARLQTSVGGPWLLRNEARARMNLPPVDGGDELIVPLNVVIGGQASPTDSAPKESA